MIKQMGNCWSLQLHREYNYSQIIRKRNWQRRGNFGFADMAGPGEPGTSRNWHFQWMGFFWSVLIVLTRYSELFAALFKLYVDLLSITTPEWSIDVFKHLNYLTELHWKKTLLQRPPWKQCFRNIFLWNDLVLPLRHLMTVSNTVNFVNLIKEKLHK